MVPGTAPILAGPGVEYAMEALVVRFGRKNSGWGHNRIVGVLANLERGSRSLNPIRKRSTRRNLTDLTVGSSLHLSLGARFGCL
jgi:hypothetical protein